MERLFNRAMGISATSNHFHFSPSTILPIFYAIVMSLTSAFVILIPSQEAFSANNGYFTVTGNMNTSRNSHTATPLSNGNILIVGGYSGQWVSTSVSDIASTELYNPTSGTFTLTGSLSMARHSHLAAKLSNGKVLIFGGYGGGTQGISASELYDPTSGIFILTGSLNTARYQHAFALLNNGKLLVTGGYNNGTLNSAELYDPATGIFTTTGTMNSGRHVHTTTLLSNGKVLIAGGQPTQSTVTNSAELYDPSTEIFTTTGSMGSERGMATATLLLNNKVLIAGGYTTNMTALSSSELYDPNTGTFTPTGSMNVPRSYNHAAVLLTDGKVLITGGNNLTPALNSAELYDPATGTFTLIDNMHSARAGHIASLLPDGKILISGGSDGSSTLASAEVYIPLAETTLGRWSLNENQGTVAVDSSGNGNDGTITSSSMWSVPGYDGSGSALSFNGSGAQSLTVPYNNILNPTSGIRVSAWMKPDSSIGAQVALPVVCNGTSGASYALSVYNNKLYLLLNYQTGGVGPFNVLGTLNITYGQWTKVAFEYDGQTVRLYVNDQLDTQASYSLPLVNNREPLYIGYDPPGNPEKFKGLIDEVVVSSISLDSGVCTYTLSSSADGFASTSALGAVTVTPSSTSCSWIATNNDSWISIISGNSGTGSGNIAYQISDNTSGSHRKGALTIAGQTMTIRQAKSIFIDDPNNVFSPYIYSIYVENITVGCGTNTYCTTNNVTRGQMAAFIIRSLYGESFTYTMTPYYTDVPSDHMFFKYVQKQKDLGITTTTGTYSVDGVVTREQMAAFIIRAKYGETFTYTLNPYYNDVPSTSIFFKYVQRLKDDATTTTTGTYNASGNVTRDQMAAFLGRAFLGMQ